MTAASSSAAAAAAALPSCQKLVLLAVALLDVASVLSVGQDSRRDKLVTTQLNAKWPSTPFTLEAAEFLAEEAGNEAFWHFVDFLVEHEEEGDRQTDREKYQGTVSFASRFLSSTQLNLMKLSLSLRTQSPRIEMFQQVAEDRGVGEKAAQCPANSPILEAGGKLHCDLSDVDLGSGPEQNGGPEIIKVDHHFPHVAEDAETVILYAEPGRTGFRKVHEALKTMASQGRIDYVLRPFLRNRRSQKTRLSGYGVELQIKSSEYKAQDDRKVNADGDGSDNDGGSDIAPEERADEIDGFDFSKLKELHPKNKDDLNEFRQHLLDQSNDMAPLKVWQLQDLSLQAAERILSGPKEKQLKMLTDLAQNFPSHARSLSKSSVSKELIKEVKKNTESFMMTMNIHTSDAALFINGMYFDMDYVDIFTILDTLRSEGRVLDGLGRLGLSDEQARKLISQDFATDKQTYGIDIRDTAVNWINDIEKDKAYKNWPSSVTELLRPTFPGMLRSIRKNFFNVIILCNPSHRSSVPLMKMLESLYVHRAPTRVGIVFAVNHEDSPDVNGKNDAGVAFLNAFNYIADHRQASDAFSFITDVYAQLGDDVAGNVPVDAVHKTFLESYGADVKMDDVFAEDSTYSYGQNIARDMLQQTGLKTFPQVLMNGVPMEEKNLDSENFEEGLMMAIMRTTNELQKAVYHNKLKDGDDMVDYLMKQPNIMPRLNDRILKAEDSANSYIPMVGDILPKLQIDTFAVLSKPSMTATLAEHMDYLTSKDGAESKLQVLTMWIVTDLDTQRGREILRGALAHVKASTLSRIGVIHNPSNPGLVSKIVKAALLLLDNRAAKHLLGKVTKEDIVTKLQSGKNLADYDIPGADMSNLSRESDAMTDEAFEIDWTFASSVLGLRKGQSAVVINGKVIGPLDETESFGLDDFSLLEKFSMSKYGERMVTNYYSFMDLKVAKVSDQAMKIISLLMMRTSTRQRNAITFYGDKHSVIKLEPKRPELPSFDITAVIDPASIGAQKIAPLLSVLSKVLNVRVTVFLNCVEKHSEMPQKSYYRAVLEPELLFSADGSLLAGPFARFANLPEEPILTMHYHIPDNWVIEPVKSVYDLDNIKLAAVDSGNVNSEFELEYLLLEGHCFEALTGNPPRGLQLTIGTEKRPFVGDTIVMANLGYLQLKSNPGKWFLNLREGRSADIFDIVAHEGTEKTEGKAIEVIMDSFQSKIIKLRVQKKPDMKNEELLEPDSTSDGEGGLWNSIKSTFSSGSSASADERDSKEETLNIFCLASGHLYERLLKIMMLGTIRHTEAPVKFWVLKNYLSPSFKEFLPEYARRYNFSFEYVQYKWPRWLNQQKEKQRIIWGYKILFLDVMFPLDVKKIIFIDTDQIVRADLTELRDMDLKGAPYGYTPFCDSNKDMEGFRFWKSGYWRNHLSGRPYHISALYVVDLVRFRRVAAGDRLRGQYQALSQDPNSLANLDQDLPNNMIHQVPIFSLPQDWLWCETWCDQESKKTAKSIDLCNNPLTKESKLDAARRIAPEWTNYDDEMSRLTEEIREGLSSGAKLPLDTSDGEGHKHTEL